MLTEKADLRIGFFFIPAVAPRNARVISVPPWGDGNAIGKIKGMGVRNYRDEGLLPLKNLPASLILTDPGLAKTASNERVALNQIARILKVPSSGARRISTPDGVDDVFITKESLRHFIEQGGNRARFVKYIEPTLENPLEVWLAVEKIGRKKILRRRFISVFDGDKKTRTLVVTQENDDGSLFWTFVPNTKEKNYMDNKREGVLLYKIEEGQ